MFEAFGVVGIVISVLAYLPQVVHLARERCSAGVSGRAWAMWLTSSVLVGALAVHRHDPVFVLLQLSTLASALIILFLVHRYRGMVCAGHALACQAPITGRVDVQPPKVEIELPHEFVAGDRFWGQVQGFQGTLGGRRGGNHRSARNRVGARKQG